MNFYCDDIIFVVLIWFNFVLLYFTGVAADGKAFTDPEVLRRLTSSVSSALDEAAAALTRMRSQTSKPNSNTSSSEQGIKSSLLYLRENIKLVFN